MTNLIIVGAGGFGLEVAAYAQDCKLTIKGFLDDTKSVGQYHADCPILGGTAAQPENDTLYVVAVGDPAARKTLVGRLSAKGAKFASIIHPLAYVAPTAKIGTGSIIAPFAFVGPQAHIGKHCVLNTHASAGHESTMDDYCALSPYAGTHGEAKLGLAVFLGSNAYITAKMKVGDNSKVAAGAVVYNDIPANSMAMGNPAACRKEGR